MLRSIMYCSTRFSSVILCSPLVVGMIIDESPVVSGIRLRAIFS